MARDTRFGTFVAAVREIVRADVSPLETTRAVSTEIGDLLAKWSMPDARYRALHPQKPYGSFLLYRAPAEEGFVVILDTFAAGQTTAIHNHRTWAAVGLIAGRESDSRYGVPAGLDGPPTLLCTSETRPGDVCIFQEPEFHQLRTVGETDSLSFHVYGADVGLIRRLRWDDARGRYAEFCQGYYSNEAFGLPTYLVD